MMTYVLAGLLAVSVALGFGLYKQVQANGIYKANEITYQAAIDDASKRISAQIEDRKQTEALLIEHQGNVRKIVKHKEVVKQVIQEVKVHAPPEDCVHQPMPDVIYQCLRDGHCGSID